jgi:hypothetical protein
MTTIVNMDSGARQAVCLDAGVTQGAEVRNCDTQSRIALLDLPNHEEITSNDPSPFFKQLPDIAVNLALPRSRCCKPVYKFQN